MFGILQNIKTDKPSLDVARFDSFVHGLNTAKPADRISATEASQLINWKILKGGGLKTRPGVVKHTATATTSNAAVKTIKEVNIGGTLYDLVVDANHVLYYIDGDKELQTIGTLEGDAQIESFNGIAAIADGSYLKYLDGVSSIKIAYDAGSGTRAFQFDNTSTTDGSGLNLGNGTIERVAYKFTTQAWTAGYTLPPVKVSVYLQRVNPDTALTGNITVSLRKVSDDSVLATKTISTAAGVGTSASAIYYATFASTDVTTEMSPSTAYYLSLEYDGGDATNYISVRCSTETSGVAYTHNGSAWSADTTKSPLMSLSPTRPPKGKFFQIWNRRLWIGGDPDNPGWAWYGNLTHLDWSTDDGGGYIGLVDDDNNNFECGALISFYGDLYAFGTQSQPYLVKISGTSPASYAQETAFQKPWATHKTISSSVNDLWYAGDDGVSPMSGVQEYGDLRTFFASDPIYDRIRDYWDTEDSLMQYYPADGQLWLALPSYHRVLVCHTKFASRGPDGHVRYPWSEYELYRDDFSDTDNYRWACPVGMDGWSGTDEDVYMLRSSTPPDPAISGKPDFITMDGVKITEGDIDSLTDHQWAYAPDHTAPPYYTIFIKDVSGNPNDSGVDIRSVFVPGCLAQCGSNFLIGGPDGYVWKVDESDYKDDSTIQIKPKWLSAYMETPFSYAAFSEVQLLASSKTGGRMRMRFFVDSGYAADSANLTKNMAWRDNLFVSEAVMDVEDALFSLSASATPLFEYVNFNARALMVGVDNVFIVGEPIFFDGVLLKYRRLST